MSRLITAYQTSLAHTSPVMSYTLTAHGGGSLREFIYYQAQTGILSFNWIETLRHWHHVAQICTYCTCRISSIFCPWRLENDIARDVATGLHASNSIAGGAKAMLGRTRPCANERRM